MVRLGLAGAVTDAGLTAHSGVPVVSTGVTAQERLTSAPEGDESTVRLEVEVPPGSTANGDGAETFKVTCPKAGAEAATSTTTTNTAQLPEQLHFSWKRRAFADIAPDPVLPAANLPLTNLVVSNLALANLVLAKTDFPEMKFNMSRGWFNYLRFIRPDKRCLYPLAFRDSCCRKGACPRVVPLIL
jgi:hypothetical protein